MRDSPRLTSGKQRNPLNLIDRGLHKECALAILNRRSRTEAARNSNKWRTNFLMVSMITDSSDDAPLFTRESSAEENQSLSEALNPRLSQGGPVSLAVKRAPHMRETEGSIPSPATKTFLFVPLSRGLMAKIDPEDGPLVGSYKWSANETVPGRFYAQADNPDGRAVYLHRLIVDAPADVLVDHRNGDTLDCRRKNLRLATTAQNRWNSHRQRSTTGYIGVVMRPGFRYQAKIMHAKRFLHLGYFDTPEEAASVYDAKALELRGEFAVLNFPPPPVNASLGHAGKPTAK